MEPVPAADKKKLSKTKDLRIDQAVPWRTIFLHLDPSRNNPPLITDNAGKPLGKNPFMDIRVRRAMSMAIKRARAALVVAPVELRGGAAVGSVFSTLTHKMQKAGGGDKDIESMIGDQRSQR